MEDMNLGVNGGEVAEPQNDVIDNSADVEVGGVNESVDSSVNDVDGIVDDLENTEVDNPENERIAQTPEENAAYARARREYETRVRQAEESARDNVIASMGMEWNGTPIATYAEYQRALREKQLQEEAQERGIDPKFYTEFQMMQEEVSNYRREATLSKQDYELAADPIKGSYYTAWKDDIRQLADQHNCDLNTAFSVLLTQRLDEVLSMNQKKIQNETINNINANSGSSPGSLGGANEQQSLDAWSMSDNDFEAMKARALRGELRR